MKFFSPLYETSDLLVVDKPAGIITFPEGKIKDKTLIDYLLEKYPDLKNAGEAPRYGVVHRLDKDTSGIILVARNNNSLLFLQKQFKTRKVEKKYITLVIGKIKEGPEGYPGIIKTLIGRSPKDKKKQKIFFAGEPGSQNKRETITEYRVLERFDEYTLLEVKPKTGRKHQIRCHLAYIGHPVAGDKLYAFKNSPLPKGLNRHFLHASYLKFEAPNGEIKETKSELPEELKKIIKDLKPKNYEQSN